MPDKETTEGKRRPYSRPRLERVALKPEEAVMASCKNNNPGAARFTCSPFFGCGVKTGS